MALCAVMSLSAAAQKPNLSGVWKLNAARSFFAGDHPENNYELTKIFEQRDMQITQTDIVTNATIMNIPLPDSRSTMDLVFDGHEHDASGPNRFPGKSALAQIKILAVWQGGTLVLIETCRESWGPSATHRRYFLSEDGSELIELVERHSRMEDTEQRLVFEKSPLP